MVVVVDVVVVVVGGSSGVPSSSTSTTDSRFRGAGIAVPSLYPSVSTPSSAKTRSWKKPTHSSSGSAKVTAMSKK